jgi:DNA-binding transcriptional ArsR family regulator
VRAELRIDTVSRAAVLLKPLRLELLQALAEPRTCSELGAMLGLTPQRAHYHVKVLENAGLVELVRSRQVRGTVEGTYRAAAGSYWLSADLVARLGGQRRSRDQLSLGYIQSCAESMLADLARLSRGTEPVDSLGLSATIELADAAARHAFMTELRQAFEGLAEKYGARDGAAGARTYRLLSACYSAPAEPIEEGDQ